MQDQAQTFPIGLRAAAGDWLVALGRAGVATLLAAFLAAFLIAWSDDSYFPSLFDGEGTPYVVGFIGLTAVFLSASSRLRSVITDADGLALLTVSGRQDRWIPWGDLRGVQRGRGVLTISSTGGRVSVTSSLVGRAELLAELERRATGEPRTQWRRTPAARLVDSLLQVAPVGLALALALGLEGCWSGHVSEAFESGSIWLREACYCGDDELFGGLMVLTALQAALVLVAARRWRVARVDVDGTGVRIYRLAGRPTVLPWSTIRGASLRPWGLRLWTCEGSVWVHSSLRRASELRDQIDQRAGSVPPSERAPECEVFGRSLAAWLLDGLLPLQILVLGQLLLLADLAIKLPFPPVLTLAGCLTLLAVWAGLRQPRVSRVVVGPDTLRLDRLAGEPETVPWSAVRGIERTIGGWRVTTSSGPVGWTSSLRRPKMLMTAARQAIERHRPAAVETSVDDRELSDWLGVGEGEVLRVRALRLRRVLVGLGLWLGSAAAIAPLLHQLGEFLGAPVTSAQAGLAATELGAAGLILFWLLYMPLTTAQALRADALRVVEASVHGLRWREGRYWSEAGWDEVTAVSLVGRAHREALFYWTRGQMLADRELLVECGGRSFRFNPRDDHAPELQAALDRLLAARRVGRTVPGLPGISPRSLSRAAPAAGSDASRGISRV